MPPTLTRHALPEGAIAIVSGSGLKLGGILEQIDRRIPFRDVPGMRDSTVAGHDSCFILGKCGRRSVIVQSGRLHPYEGLSFEEVTQPVRALHDFGVRTVIYTNAVGALDRNLLPGSLVVALSVNAWCYPRYTLPEMIKPDFIAPGCDAYGDYWWMHGPCYETRAEVAALRGRGALAVGMSVAPELTACGKLGIRTAVVSCVTNNCITEEHVSHEQVIEVARNSGARLVEMLRSILY